MLFLLVFAPVFGGQVSVVNTVTCDYAYPWQKIELLHDSTEDFVEEIFHPASTRAHSSIRKAFQTDRPHSSKVLLHYAPGWSDSSGSIPVILLHGAGDNASRGFAHPYTFDIPESGKIDKPGIMQHLVSKGFSVFAVTYSHPHGCNFLQAHQLGNAIERVRQVTGSQKVDIVCHSKGAMSARIYASDLASHYDEFNWIRRYAGDINRILFIASPLKGLDTAFRYYMYNFSVLGNRMAAPLGPDSILWQGIFIDTSSHNSFFPGQFQMLHNWVKDGIAFNYQSATTDFNVTRNALYNGGTTAFLSSGGIDKAIQKAGNVIEYLNRLGLDPNIEAHVMAGTRQDIDSIDFFWFKVPIGEFACESDGVVFLKSATYTDGLIAQGASVGSVEIFNTHHVGLTVLPEALDNIVEVLSGRRNTD